MSDSAVKKRRLTVDLEADLLTLVDRLAAARNESRNTFIARAIERRVRDLERARIDEAFGGMANDPRYQRVLERIEAEMAGASDTAWGVAEEAAGYTGEAPAPRSRKRRRGAR